MSVIKKLSCQMHVEISVVFMGDHNIDQLFIQTLRDMETRVSLNMHGYGSVSTNVNI